MMILFSDHSTCYLFYSDCNMATILMASSHFVSYAEITDCLYYAMYLIINGSLSTSHYTITHHTQDSHSYYWDTNHAGMAGNRYSFNYHLLLHVMLTIHAYLLGSMSLTHFLVLVGACPLSLLVCGLGNCLDAAGYWRDMQWIALSGLRIRVRYFLLLSFSGPCWANIVIA